MATVQVLVVAGGGYGGSGGNGGTYNSGGGGGGGGVKYDSAYSIVSGTGYTVTVGAANQNSVFDTITAHAGGVGGTTNGGSGGSGGGGGSGTLAGTGGTGTAGEGYNGGNGYNGSFNSAGGGGGATGAGTNAVSNVAGTGGPGYTSSISGASVTYSKGGNGAHYGTTGNGANGVNPGDGGNGASTVAGTTYTGGGGATGIVIISAPIGTIMSATGGTHTTSGGNDIWTFTSSGTWTPITMYSASLTVSIMNSVSRLATLSTQTLRIINLSVSIMNAVSRFVTLVTTYIPNLGAPDITVRQASAPWSIVSVLNYIKTTIVGSSFPILNTEVSDSIKLRIYNNFAGNGDVSYAINVNVTTFDGTGHTASMNVASQQWLHVIQTGFGSGSSGPAAYTALDPSMSNLTDTTVGGSVDYVFNYASDGTQASTISTGTFYNRAGFLEFNSYIQPLDGVTGQTNAFVVSVRYEYVI